MFPPQPPTFNLAGKTIAITGGSGGIGLATVELLLAEGANVSIADSSSHTLKEAETKISKAGLKGKAAYHVVDVRKVDQVNGWISHTVERWGKLDGAVNLAGVLPKGFATERIEELDEDGWEFSIGVNLTGVMHCLRAEIPHVKEGGSIVNASSIAGLMGFAKNAAYVAAKHGVTGLTKAAAKEVGDRNIRVNCIAPGSVDTPMTKEAIRIRGGEGNYGSQIKRKAAPEEIAALIAWLLCDASSYITGTTQIIDGGIVC